MKRTMGLVALVAAAGVTLSGCSVFGGDDKGGDGPGRVESVQGASGEIKESTEVPEVAGLDVHAPSDDTDARKVMRDTAKWWLDPATSETDREKVSGWMLSLANDNASSEDPTNKFLAQKTLDLARSGYEVNLDSLNTNQSQAKIAFGL